MNEKFDFWFDSKFSFKKSFVLKFLFEWLVIKNEIRSDKIDKNENVRNEIILRFIWSKSSFREFINIWKFDMWRKLRNEFWFRCKKIVVMKILIWIFRFCSFINIREVDLYQFMIQRFFVFFDRKIWKVWKRELIFVRMCWKNRNWNNFFFMKLALLTRFFLIWFLNLMWFKSDFFIFFQYAITFFQYSKSFNRFISFWNRVFALIIFIFEKFRILRFFFRFNFFFLFHEILFFLLSDINIFFYHLTSLWFRLFQSNFLLKSLFYRNWRNT